MFEGLDPFGFACGDPAGQTVIDVSLTDPGPDRLDAVAELIGDPFRAATVLTQFLAERADQTDRPLLLLWAVPACCCLLRWLFRGHGLILVSKVRSLQETQGDSLGNDVDSSAPSGLYLGFSDGREVDTDCAAELVELFGKQWRGVSGLSRPCFRKLAVFQFGH